MQNFLPVMTSRGLSGDKSTPFLSLTGPLWGKRLSESLWPQVFVGRCADYILRDYPNTFNIFVTAKMSYRIQQVANRHQCDEATARKIISHEEDTRASYYNYYTGKKWGHSQSYDLCVDSTILGLEGTAEMIAQFIRDGLKSSTVEGE